MEKHMNGSVEFYNDNEIHESQRPSFCGDPAKVENNQRRLRIKIDGKMVYIVLKGLFCDINRIQIVSIYNRFIKAQKEREMVAEVSRVFYSEVENSTANVAKITGFTKHQVSRIITNKLLKREEVTP